MGVAKGNEFEAKSIKLKLSKGDYIQGFQKHKGKLLVFTNKKVFEIKARITKEEIMKVVKKWLNETTDEVLIKEIRRLREEGFNIPPR